MFDVGAGEAIVIVLVAVLVMGPGRLPGAVATLAQWVRVIRGQAAAARSQIAEAAALDPSISSTLSGLQDDLRDVHPRRLLDDLAAPPLPRDQGTSGRSARREDAGAAAPAFDPDAT